jgi:hypothetical protein
VIFKVPYVGENDAAAVALVRTTFKLYFCLDRSYFLFKKPVIVVALGLSPTTGMHPVSDKR